MGTSCLPGVQRTRTVVTPGAQEFSSEAFHADQHDIQLRRRTIGIYMALQIQALPIRDVGRKVFLISSNLSIHRTKPIKEWLLTRKDRIEIIYLQNYNPEHNPK